MNDHDEANLMNEILESYRQEGFMKIDELTQYHEEYRAWLDMTCRDNLDDVIRSHDQME